MSSINPNNIDGTYPIAGQDNDSQGFRDNFTNIKNNFTFAKSEIEDMQGKVILKSALAGVAFDNNMNYAQLSSVELLRATETVNDLGPISDTITLSWDNGSFQHVELGAVGVQSDLSTGWPTSNMHAAVKLEITVPNATYTLILDTSIITESLKKIRGVIYDGSNYILTFAKTGTYTYEFSTYDGGSTVWMRELTDSTRPIDYQIISGVGNGDTVDLDPGIRTFIVVPTGGTIAAATINMPGNTQVFDGDTISFAFGGTITALTISGNGAAMSGALTTGVSTGPAKYVYIDSTATWYRTV